jgi:hypothetical protein
MLSDGLQSLFLATPAITALVGTSRTDKTNGIFPGLAPAQTPAPYMVMRWSAAEDLMTMDGPAGWATVRVLVGCYAKQYVDAKQLALAVRKTCEAFTGALSDGSVIGNMKTTREEDTFEDGPFLYGTFVELEIFYSYS